MPILHRMSIHKPTERDFPYILDLSKKHAEELGFIPRLAMLNYLQRDRMALARENGEPCGYFLASALGKRQLRIFQACVQYDARGLSHGLALLSHLIADAADSGTHFLSLHCRDGLESNGFWSACGFTSGGLIPGGKARGKIVHQWELDIRTALGCPVLPYARYYLARLGKRAAEGTGTDPREVGPDPPTLRQLLDTRESNVIASARALAKFDHCQAHSPRGLPLTVTSNTLHLRHVG
jgi:ribosomal protein S18 acetylase RimI-like enzyme